MHIHIHTYMQVLNELNQERIRREDAEGQLQEMTDLLQKERSNISEAQAALTCVSFVLAVYVCMREFCACVCMYA